MTKYAGFRKKSAPKATAAPTETSQAVRIGVELGAGVLVGIVLGIFLDRWFGTSPVFFMACFLLGTAAGFRNVWRASQQLEAEADRQAKTNETIRNDTHD